MPVQKIVPDSTAADRGIDRSGSTSDWQDCVYVDAHGPCADQSGARVEDDVRFSHEIVNYARALLRSDIDDVRFIWIAGTDWLLVSIRIETPTFAAARARIHSEVIDPPFGLTSRELDVLTLVAAGLANETIGARLEISVRTVTKHIENIFGKTGLWTRTGLASFAMDRGMVRLPTPGGCDGITIAPGRIESLTQNPLTSVAPKTRRLSPRPILIGMPLSLTGRGADDAQEMLNGATLAVEQLNRRGGVNGRALRLVTADTDLGQVKSLVEAHRSLIDLEVDAITAGYSCVDPAVQRLVGDFGGPYLHAATMDYAVKCVRNDFSRLGNIFQVCASDINYGPGLIRFLNGLEAHKQWEPDNRRIAVVQPPWPGLDIGLQNTNWGRGQREWSIELITDVPPSSESWDPVVDRLHRINPSVVVLASYFVEDGIAFQKAFMRRPIRSLVYKLYSPSAPAYLTELGGLADGVIWATTTGLYSDRIGQGFIESYRRRFDRDPGHSHASIAYDRVNLLAGTWSRVGGTRVFKTVIEDLRTTVHRGVNGSYFFGSEGQVGLAFPDDTQDPSISQAHLVFQVQNGRQRILSPHPYSNGMFIPPGWLADRAIM